MLDTERVLEEEGSGPPDSTVKVFFMGVAVGMILGLIMMGYGIWGHKVLAFLMYGA